MTPLPHGERITTAVDLEPQRRVTMPLRERVDRLTNAARLQAEAVEMLRDSMETLAAIDLTSRPHIQQTVDLAERVLGQFRHALAVEIGKATIGDIAQAKSTTEVDISDLRAAAEGVMRERLARLGGPREVGPVPEIRR